MMKTILLFLSIFCCLNLSGQSVDIPDATFKSYLLGNSNINTNNDAEIQYSEANSFQGNIDVKYLYITNLTGIEAFINLDSLNCYGTYLTNLDLSQNINLKHLEFGGWNTNFTTIDLSQNINLESLRYSLTSIESLDLTLNTKLEFVDINSNYLTHLDVSGLSFLSWLDLSPGSLLTLNASACTSLTHFGFSQSYAMESADFSGCISLEYLNIQAGLTHLYIAGCGALKTLNCNWNQLTDLDISTNNALEDLYCCDNELTNLNVSNHSNLSWLHCDNNQLTSLHLSTNGVLTNLRCLNNQLDTLDLSENIMLTSLYCGGNQLTDLDLSENTMLTSLYCSENQLTNLDLHQNVALESLYCSFNDLTSLDLSHNEDLFLVYCDNNQLTGLDVSENKGLYILHAYANQLNCLNIANGESLCFYNLRLQDNPSLNCIEVDYLPFLPAYPNNCQLPNHLLDIPNSGYSINCNNSCSNAHPEQTCFVGIDEHTNTNKTLIKIFDYWGRETSFKPNTPLIYLYNDGSTEKIFVTE